MAKKTPFLACTPVMLPESEWEAAAKTAIDENPANATAQELSLMAMTALTGAPLSPRHLAALTGKYWGKKGVKLGVQFLDNPDRATRDKILAHANAWGKKANIKFAESAQGQIRISRAAGGYWSYLGTDCLRIPSGKATMNLQGFTSRTSDREYCRVVRHEFGHACGFPHEHMRRDITELLDVAKTIRYFQKTQGWSQSMTISQVLTPLEESSLMGSPVSEQTSIMTYHLPAECTKSGRPIVGGTDITEADHDWVAKLYPKPEPEPDPDVAGIRIDLANRVITAPGFTLKNA